MYRNDRMATVPAFGNKLRYDPLLYQNAGHRMARQEVKFSENETTRSGLKY